MKTFTRAKIVLLSMWAVSLASNRTAAMTGGLSAKSTAAVCSTAARPMGGVIAYWLDYGGTVQKCFNFGKITTNTNDKNSGYGAVGGIVGFIDQPISGGTTNAFLP